MGPPFPFSSGSTSLVVVVELLGEGLAWRLNLTTMTERLSVLKRVRAWSTSILEAVAGEEMLRIRSTASWSVQTSHSYVSKVSVLL